MNSAIVSPTLAHFGSLQLPREFPHVHQPSPPSEAVRKYNDAIYRWTRQLSAINQVQIDHEAQVRGPASVSDSPRASLDHARKSVPSF
ncbi:hypothetical protein CROQUDRAFT_649862 [Cronartium quercuum f. sp. fusiforme G11]|uniref:Uncharacterized protein n=1 Tax=Cronartium quercuum f. sp. fusiforme G11 TaxID=708437 RepID=A0A9P6TI69_9BASI|nr:hypothetical protein CROQUDRAFT_649862 [Cronartium quercuum f. sp. fusiforme G11]